MASPDFTTNFNDSIVDKNYRKLIRTLNFAPDSEFVVLRNVMHGWVPLFPCGSILKDLFAFHRVLMFRKENGNYKKIDYKTRRRRRNPSARLSIVYERGTKKVLFETGYHPQ